MPSNQQVKAFYDEFTEYELQTGVNLRHFTICNTVIAAGLKRNHRVLEIGCGIGQLTGLLHRYLRQGKMVSTDISPRSVEIARSRVGPSSRIEFIVTDMVGFTHEGQFDFIVMPDVLEHIPIENHQELFGQIAKLMHDDSRLIIHIPHPKYIEYDGIHHADKLQIIDQPLPADELTRKAYAQGLILETYHAYQLFQHETDYIFITFRKNRLYKYVPFTKSRIILKKSIERIRYAYNLFF